MRILYIAMDNPAVDTILGGMNDESLAGLPAFYYPFKMLLEKGNTIDLMLISNEEHEVIESEHFKKENFFQIRMKYSGALGMLEFPRLLRRETCRRLKAQHYDFVYGMSEGSHMGVRVAAKMGIPCALRQFGTRELANALKAINGKLRRWIEAFRNYTYITLSLISKKTYMLTTNDGSASDELFELLGVKKKRFNFFFWRSGIKMPKKQPYVDNYTNGDYPNSYDPMCLTQIARIADEKCQDRSARILNELHRRGYKMHLHYVGDVSSQKMYEKTIATAAAGGITNYIHFAGGQPQERAWEYSRNALASIIPTEAGLGNVFYENMAQGSMLVVAKAPAMDEYIENGLNGFQFTDEKEAADQIEHMLLDTSKYWNIRKNAYYTAQEKFLSIEKRFGMEAELVETAAKGKSIAEFPENL